MPRLTTSALLTTALFMSGAASADSFAINEYSASDLGRANSGRTTQTIDPAASFGNPALMTEFETSQASLALASILGDATFNDDGSVDVLGAPLGNGSSGILDDAIVPAAHAIFVLNDRWRLGVSVNAPFGLSTSYDDDWAGRYQALESELKTININPSVAYRVTSTFSIGAGLSAQYADARLTSAVDFGATCFSQLGPMTCASLGLTPQAADLMNDCRIDCDIRGREKPSDHVPIWVDLAV